MWGSCEGHVRIMWGSCEGHVRIMWGSCEGHVRIMWGSCEGHVTSMTTITAAVVCTSSHTPQVDNFTPQCGGESELYTRYLNVVDLFHKTSVLLWMSNCHWTVSLYFLVLNLPYFFQASVLWKENVNVNSCYSVAILGLHCHLQHSLRPYFTPLFFPGSMPPSLPPSQVYQWCSQVFSVYQPFF